MNLVRLYCKQFQTAIYFSGLSSPRFFLGGEVSHTGPTGDLVRALETFAQMRQCSVQASVVSLSAARPCAQHSCLGGGFKYFIFLPPTWGNDPIWQAYFSIGLKPPTRCWMADRATWHPSDIWYEWLKCTSPGRGYGAICSAYIAGWHHGIHVLQQLQSDSLEPNAISLTSVAAALQQGWVTPQATSPIDPGISQVRNGE